MHRRQKVADQARSLRLAGKHRMHTLFSHIPINWLDSYQGGGNNAMTARATSWRCLAFLTCFCCTHLGLAERLSAQDSDGQGSYLLGTSTTGGTYHPVGVALSTLIKLKLLPQQGIDLTAVNTDGSQENVSLLRNDEIQFAIMSGQAGHEARSGTGDFAAAGPDDNLRAITTLWLSTDHFWCATMP
ncbi:MAG: hypothetical protein HC871_15995 [Rhizobiales bacterium]|nr:hypothetical protein [Hyphomicrobiales bacterium]